MVSAVFSLMHGHDPKDVEVVKNPDGARRSCAVVELATLEETRRSLDSFDSFVQQKKRSLLQLGLEPSSLYIRHMPNMVFPGPPGDCCSLRHVRSVDVDPIEEDSAE